MNLGFIGLGVMGLPMALNLVKNPAGDPVWGYRAFGPKRERLLAGGVRPAETAGEIYGRGGLIFLCLATDEQMAQEVRAVTAAAPAGTIVVDTGSSSPELTRNLAREARERGIFLLDCPVSGGEKGAVDGSLAMMAGGDPEAFQKARPYLETMGGTVTLMGPSGAGSVTKVINQILVGIHLAALGEAFGLARKAGLDQGAVFQAIRSGLAGSAVMEHKAPRLITRDYSPSARLAIHQKDLRHARELAAELGVELPLAMMVLDFIDERERAGGLDEDHCAVARHYEKAMGLEAD